MALAKERCRVSQLASVSTASRRLIGRWIVITAAALGACDASQPPPSSADAAPSLGAVIDAVPVAIDSALVAEMLALGGRFTDLQRDMLEKDLVGSVVQWRIVIYEVTLDDGVYKVISEPLPIQDAKATSLLRVAAFVVPRSEQDRHRMAALHTGDTLEVKGQVRHLMVRAVLTLSPAIMVGPT